MQLLGQHSTDSPTHLAGSATHGHDCNGAGQLPQQLHSGVIHNKAFCGGVEADELCSVTSPGSPHGCCGCLFRDGGWAVVPVQLTEGSGAQRSERGEGGRGGRLAPSPTSGSPFH